jgi:hypothetical protein
VPDEMFAEILMLSAGGVLLYYLERAAGYGWPVGRLFLLFGNLIAFGSVIYAIIVMFIKYGFTNALIGFGISLVIYIIPWVSLFKYYIQSICAIIIIISFFISISTF